MEAFLEILKYILPSLVVFCTVYFVMKRYLDHQYKVSSLELRKDQYENTLPIKLQAYERLALFCERISVDNLAFRLTNSNTNAALLSKAMLVAVQQEWEHNLSQQIYTSDNLWSIITLAKNDIQSLITEAAAKVDSQTAPSSLLEEISKIKATRKIDPIAAAKLAIREESQLLF